MNEKLYKLLDDCHTALAKITLDDKQYNELSKRLVDYKAGLLKNLKENLSQCKCGASVRVECDSCMESRILGGLES